MKRIQFDITHYDDEFGPKRGRVTWELILNLTRRHSIKVYKIAGKWFPRIEHWCTFVQGIDSEYERPGYKLHSTYVITEIQGVTND